MTIAEEKRRKKEFVNNNLLDFKHSEMLQIFWNSTPEFQVEDLYKCIKKLRTNDSFLCKNFNEKLSNEKWFTFSHCGRQMHETYIYGNWDKNNTFVVNRKSGTCVPTIRIPVMFHMSVFHINQNEYIKSFLKILNDYLSFSIEGWKDALVSVSLEVTLPMSMIEKGNFINSRCVFFFQENLASCWERPIKIQIREEHPMYRWLCNFAVQKDHATPKASPDRMQIITLTQDGFNQLKYELKVTTDMEAEEILCNRKDTFRKGYIIGKAVFPISKKGNYSYVKQVEE